MKQARIFTDRHFAFSEIDKRIYGSFLEHMGRAVYEGVYQPGNKNADKDGFRRDVMDAVRELCVPLIRYPGGNMVSSYRWEDSVGPRGKRPVCIEPAWQNLEDNTFGLGEFMDWSKQVNTAPMMAVNLGTRGAADAKNLIEYCNFPGGTYYSDMRIAHGYRDPYNIKLWCLGNEMDGPWQIGHKSADEYGSLAAQTAKLMKLIDPSIELCACGSAGISLPTFAEWDAKVLDYCYDLVDYISVHTYFDNRCKTDADTREYFANSLSLDNQLEGIIAAADYVRAKKKKKKTIGLSLDEWNVVYRPHGKVPDEKWTKAPHEIEDTYSMEDVILFGALLNSIINHSDRVKIACLAQLVNVIAPIMTSDNACWKQTIFYPFSIMSRLGRGEALRFTVDCPVYETRNFGSVNLLDCSIVENREEERVTLFLVNRDLEEGLEVSCDLRQYEGYEISDFTVINHENIKAQNTEEHPDTVVPRAGKDASFAGGILTLPLEKHSWNTVTLRKKQL